MEWVLYLTIISFDGLPAYRQIPFHTQMACEEKLAELLERNKTHPEYGLLGKCEKQ